MKMMKLGWCIVAVFFLGCATASPPPATASQSVQSTSSAPGTKNDPREGKVCEVYKVTGTQMNREVCRTPEEVKAEREAAEKLIRDSQRKGYIRP